jgi:hypothetical protein
MKFYDEQDRINKMSYSQMTSYMNEDKRDFMYEELMYELRDEDEYLRREYEIYGKVSYNKTSK